MDERLSTLLPAIRNSVLFRFSDNHVSVERPNLAHLSLASVPRDALVVIVAHEQSDAAWSARLSDRLGLARIDDCYVGVGASGVVSVTTIAGQRFLDVVPSDGVRALWVRERVAEPFILGEDGIGSTWSERDSIPTQWLWRADHAPKPTPRADFHNWPFKVRAQIDDRMRILDVDPGLWVAANPFYYFIPRLWHEDYLVAPTAVRALAEGRPLTPSEWSSLHGATHAAITEVDDTYALHEEEDPLSLPLSPRRFASVEALREAVIKHLAASAEGRKT